RVGQPARRAQLVGRDDRGRDREGRERGALEGHGKSRDDVRRRAGDGGGGDRFDGEVAVFRVILRDVDERDRGGDSDHAAQGEVPPRGREGGRVEQPVRATHEARGGEHRGPHVPAVERVHRVLVFT